MVTSSPRQHPALPLRLCPVEGTAPLNNDPVKIPRFPFTSFLPRTSTASQTPGLSIAFLKMRPRSAPPLSCLGLDPPSDINTSHTHHRSATDRDPASSTRHSCSGPRPTVHVFLNPCANLAFCPTCLSLSCPRQSAHPTELTCERHHVPPVSGVRIHTSKPSSAPASTEPLGTATLQGVTRSYEELTLKHLRPWAVMAPHPPCSLILISEPHLRACGLLCPPLRHWPLDRPLRCWHQPPPASCFPLLIIP